MRVETLPSPGLLSNGIRVRIEAAKAISAVEITAGLSGGKTSTANALKGFFDACSTAVAGFVDVVVPTLVSAVINAANPKRIVLTFTEGLDDFSIPATTAFVTATQVKAVSKVTIEENRVYVDVTAAFVAGAVTIAYTKPGSGAVVQDDAGNDLASFTATAVTNALV
jgi:hypothetical protein